MKTMHKEKTGSRKQFFMGAVMFLLIWCLYAGSALGANADSENSAASKKVSITYYAALVKGDPLTLYFDDLAKAYDGKIKWKVANKKVAKLTKQTKKKIVIKGVKNGKTTVTTNNKKFSVKIVVNVVPKNKYLKTFCNYWVKNYITKDMTDLERILTASIFVTHNQDLEYGSGYGSTAEDLLLKGKGTCYGGGKLVAELCKAMGYKAKLRSAVKDNMSRYPAGIMFGSDHYNVEVIVKGKKYYTDGTPGKYFTYLSSSKKPLALIINGMSM